MAEDMVSDILGTPSRGASPTEDARRLALWAEALGPIIRLHDREADNALLQGLWQADFPALAEAMLEPAGQVEVARGFALALAGLPRPAPQPVLDELAADFADAYLTHGFRAAPTGSVWLTEDHLERQQPMFDVREFYAHYGLSVPDWRLRSDDHIVHELQFLVHLLALESADALADAALFLDRHLLPWAPDFCLTIAARARQPFTAGCALLTRAMLLALRDDLASVTGIAPAILPHAWAIQQEREGREARAEEERPFVPGIAESW